MKQFLKVVGITMLVLAALSLLPIVGGFATLDGELRVFGDIKEVVPFWGGFIYILAVESITLTIVFAIVVFVAMIEFLANW